MTDMYVVIFVVLFSAFCLLCCVVRFRVFVTLFTILPLCLSLYIQFLGETSDQYVLFCFFFFCPPRILWCCFFSWCPPPRVIRVKYGPSVTIWTLPCLLPVSPHIKLSHYTHPNHSRTSVSFRSCVCDFCIECVFCLELCLGSRVLCTYFGSCVCLFAHLCLLLC